MSLPLPDLSSHAFKRDPFPILDRLREEAPVCEVRLGRRGRGWLVTRHSDCVELLKDPRFLKDPRRAAGAKPLWMPAFARPLARNMLDLDEPDHRRLRGLVQQAFSARLVEAIRPRIESLATELLDRAEPRGRVDLVAHYAASIPTTIIAELLGAPASDRERLHRWTSTIVAADASGAASLRAVPAIFSFMRYLRRLIVAKREAPAEDLLSALVAAEADGERLDEDELVAMAFLLLVAGHETTSGLIANGMFELLQRPAEVQRLRADPTLAASAVEELLRFCGPLMTATERYAGEGAQISGQPIPRGALVYAVLASANRDPSAFAAPDRLDLSRRPNRHLAFGDGPHFCAGAALARMEAQIAILALIRRFPNLRLAAAPESLKWKPGLVVRTLRELPVSF